MKKNDNTQLIVLGAVGLGLAWYFYQRKAGASTPGTYPPGTLPPTIPPPRPPVNPPVNPPIPPSTPSNDTAINVSLHLKDVQKRYGMPGAKGKEDKLLVKQAQELLGFSGKGVDGLAGPGTLLRLADVTPDLPLVMYWPKGSTKASVEAYKAKLLGMANLAIGKRAEDLRASASRERGQAGIG